MNNFASKISKSTIPGKLDAGEDPRIEGYANPNIQDMYSLTPKTLPVYYADMLLPLTKIFRVKNICCSLRNHQSGKI